MEVNEDLAEAGPAVGAAPAASQSADVFFCSSHHVEAERSISPLMDAQSLHLHSLLTDCCCCGLECVFFFFFLPLLDFQEVMRANLLSRAFLSTTGSRR